MTRFTAWIVILAGASIQVAPAAPQSVTAHYNVSRNGVTIAVIRELFDSHDGRYQIVSETRAIGILALLQRRPGRVTSSGTVGRDGLQPKIFDGTRGKNDKRHVHADFDWSGHTLTLTYDGRTETVALPDGTQDRLSVMYQFTYLDATKLRTFAFSMTNGRKIDEYRYGIGPDTELDTPLGRLMVVHLVKKHAAGETATEIWLARDHQLMPVKMRIIEDDGSRYEQIIARLEMRD